MKTTNFKQPWRALGQAVSSRWALGAGLVSALLLSAVQLEASPTVTTLGGGPSSGYADGDTTQIALFHTPVGLALDDVGSTLYVADRDNNAIRRLDLGANLTITFATYGVSQPIGVAVDKAGNVYVLNRGNGSNGTVQKFDIFGNYLATLASGLANANGMAMDSIGDLYVTVNNNSVLEIAPDGTKTTVTSIATANTVLRGITIMDNGYLAVCDSGNNGIWSINPSTGVAAGLTGFNGVGDHFGPKAYAKFNSPLGIAAAGNGVLVVADYGNNRVKVVDSVGTVTNLYGVDSSFWVTGDGTFPGWWDGTVCAGDINYNVQGCVESRQPNGVVFADDGTVYTSEDYYHIIRKVTGTSLPQHPAPPPAVPEPRVGWVDFTRPPSLIVSILRTAQPFVFNNDVTVAIEGTDGTETHYTFGPTPVGIDTIPDPGPNVGSTPPIYHDGMFPSQVPASIVSPQPDVTVKAIGVQSGRQSSLIVTARFQFKTANPVISGNNAALFTVTDLTTNAVMWYTLDGSDPVDGGTNSIGPIASGTTLSLNAASEVTFKIRAFRANYQDSDIVSVVFTPDTFVPNSINFGFTAGEASSDFIASPGQYFFAPVTMNVVPGTKIYSLQFNLTVTNAGPNPGPAVAPGLYRFESFLEKPIPNTDPPVFETIPPLMFAGLAANPPPASSLVTYDFLPFVDMTFRDNAYNLLGVGWLERLGMKNLYDTTKQDLIKYSQPHDTLFDEGGGKVVLGGYGFQVPANALPGQTYRIQIGLPSATSDGVGAPGSTVYIATPTNGSFTAGGANSIKFVTAGQRKYLAGDSAPFRWFNAGDFGNTNLDNSDVMQVFQSAVGIYTVDVPPVGSDLFDSMDSCGRVYTQSANGYLVPGASVANPNVLFDGNDLTINQIAFGDGVLDVCDVFVTFRRSLDPSLTLFRRFWTNGVKGAEIASGIVAAPAPTPLSLTNPPSISFASADFIATAGQTLTVPVTVKTTGNYPLRVMMVGLTVKPLDGSPALTTPIQFTPNPSLGQPTISSTFGNGSYAASWLDSTVSGISGTATIGTLTVTIPAGTTASSAYAIHFDHASGSPNGLASFPKQTLTGLITLSDRSASSFGDAIPDSWRLRYFGTINNLLTQADADADGDGASNYQEFIAGTDPADVKSALKVSNGKDSVLRWPSIAGKHYVIERSSSLFNPNWVAVSTSLVGTGTEMQFQDTAGGGVSFYRVSVAP
jgi:sugar lactone lactonase YvrE